MEQQQMEECGVYFTVVDFARLIDELGIKQAMYELIKVLDEEQASDLVRLCKGKILTSD
jgi:hypothetical protein